MNGLRVFCAAGLVLASAATVHAAGVTFRGTVPYDTRRAVPTTAPAPVDANSSISRLGAGDAPVVVRIVAGEPPIEVQATARESLQREIAGNPLLMDELAGVAVPLADVTALTIGQDGAVTI